MERILNLLEKNEQLRNLFMKIYIEAGVEKVVKSVGLEKYLRDINPIPLEQLLNEALRIAQENGLRVNTNELKKTIITWASDKLEKALANPPKK